jgi:hypothetical protein
VCVKGGTHSYLAKWEVKPTMPTSQCGRQSSWLTSSPDHLIGLEEEGRGDGEAKGLGGLEVNDQFELMGALHRQVCRFGTFQNFVHKGLIPTFVS